MRFAIILLLVSAVARSALAQTPTTPGDSLNSAPEVIVTAPRGQTSGGVAPLIELSPEELESYGVDTLSDLVDALKPMTRSSRSDQQAVVLINGHLAGQVEFDNLPREAVERVEVLPETVALQYGFSENQRVLNFILREHYRAVPARGTESAATDGGAQWTSVDASRVHLDDEARITLLGSYRKNAWLRESDRGIDLPDSEDRTLLPARTDAKLATTLSHPILGVSSSLEASVELTSAKSLQGLGDPNRVLDQTTHENTSRLAGQLTGLVGHFVWGATLSYVRIQTRSASETGVDTEGDTLIDQTHSVLNAGNLQLSLSGPLYSLPAGLVIANAKVGLQYQGFDTDNAFPGVPDNRSNLVRSTRSVSFNTSLPLTSRERGVLPQLGTLAATLNLALDNVSNFGSMWSASYGLDWIPTPKVHVDAIFTDHESAPTVQQVLSPPVFTPNVEMFDYVAGETVFVTTITGGGGNLAKTDAKVTSIGLSLGPVLGKTVFSAHYERSRSSNAVGALPPLTVDVEQAFPDRFLRDLNGSLIQVDSRWINLQQQAYDDLKWGVNFWIPFGAAPPEKSMPNRLEFSLFDTWYLHDTTLIRSGVPVLDLLNGAPSDTSGGQPRHRVEYRSLLYKDGVGAGLSVVWRSATTVGDDGGELDRLHFSALGTADFRLFVDLERAPLTRSQDWAKGARASLFVMNLFDRRQSVVDGSGATPIAFSPGYLDPTGRTVWFTVRKVF
jgi:hypothetical protein